jgi:hypothetical protein
MLHDRRVVRGDARDPCEEQTGTENAAEEGHAQQPRGVLPRQTPPDRRQAGQAPSDQGAERDCAGGKVGQTGSADRADVGERSLGGRREHAERRRRSQRQQDSGGRAAAVRWGRRLKHRNVAAVG